MKTFEQFLNEGANKLNELFDNPLDYDDNGSGNFSFISNESEYNVHFKVFRKTDVKIVFDFDKDANIDKQAISTIIAIISDYLMDNRNIDTIEYSVDFDEPRTVKLFDAMTNKVAPLIDFYLHSDDKKGKSKLYVLKRD